MGKDSNTIASIQHLFKNSTNTSSTASQNTLHDHVDEGKYQPVMTHTRSYTNLPTQIGNPISFCAVTLKSSKVAGVKFKLNSTQNTLKTKVFRVVKQNVPIATS